jgi:hypothetical protein
MYRKGKPLAYVDSSYGREGAKSDFPAAQLTLKLPFMMVACGSQMYL